jgi:hypothetical protein
MEVLSLFDSVKVAPPMVVTDIENTVKVLKEK